MLDVIGATQVLDRVHPAVCDNVRNIRYVWAVTGTLVKYLQGPMGVAACPCIFVVVFS